MTSTLASWPTSLWLTLLTWPLLLHYISELNHLNNQLNIELEVNNVTKRCNKDILFFNRVPKVGSGSIMGLLSILGQKNDFGFVTDREDIKQMRGERIKLTADELEDYKQMFVNNLSQPCVYSKHTAFIEFHEEFRPVYVNMVREPIKRVVAWFYYIRAPWYQFEEGSDGNYTSLRPIFGASPTPFKQNYEECLENSDAECTFITGQDKYREGDAFGSQIAFFCGHEHLCHIWNHPQALQRAKRNVENHYSVVGLLEQFETSLQLMERLIPRFFVNATAVYKERKAEFSDINRNNFKPKISNDLLERLRPNFTNEIEFYNFCRQRFHKQIRLYL